MALTKLQNKKSTDIDTEIPSEQQFSEFVLSQNFVFRVKDVDCFLHAEQAEGASITAVYLKGYTCHIEDPAKNLFQFLCTKMQPKSIASE